MATIEDVAKLAGLSRTTVSRVINNQPYVTEEKRARVIQTMNDLGYVPNSSARRLRNRRTDTIAVLLPRITNPFFGNLIELMEEKASKWGYQVIVCQTHDDKKKELDYLQLVKTKQVDGVIMASLINDWKDVQPYLDSGPIILCHEYLRDEPVPMIHMDHRKAAYEATTHLIEEGCRNIAYISGGPKSYLSSERRRGFKQALTKANLPPFDEVMVDWALDVRDGQQVFRDLEQCITGVDGVFTGSDEVAAGIIYEATQSGWAIPDDLAVIGFDNQMLSLLMVPSISTVEQPIKQMAERTIEVLIQQLTDPHSVPGQRFVYEHQLLIRDSTIQTVKTVQ